MNQPLVSIVLPTYNGSKYIKQSVDSCLRQTYTNIELIIVNDCSTDNTQEIIDSYAAADNRVKVIRNVYNKKLPRSLNTGFEIAKGKYFTWTSDDNYYALDAIATLVGILEKNESVDLVYTDYKEIDDEGIVIGSKKFGNIYDSFVNWVGCGACFLYKAEVHKKNNGYEPSAFLIEDYDFFVRTYLNGFSFYYLPVDTHYFYRQHSLSLTGTQASVVNDIQKIIIERQLSKLVSKVSLKDKMLLYRKYAVFYGVFKNNTDKMRYYLKLLRQQSFSQFSVTVFFIVFRKIVTSVKMSFDAVVSLFEFAFIQRENK
jgi:glycosyltransferase involved in cell wall biosynthesis